MTFDFPIRQTLRTAWVTYKTHWQFFFGMSIVTLLINAASITTDRLVGISNIVATLCLVLVAVVWSFVWIKVSLAVVRGNESMPTLGNLREMLPTGAQFFMLLGIGLLTGVIVLGGFLALIIPGVYFMTRLAFVNLSFVDKNLGVAGSIKYSWHLVSGERFWTVLLVLLVVLVLIVIGVFTYGVALIVLYPLAMLLVAHLYKVLDDFHLANSLKEEK